jgi:hypothetical protein
LTTGESRTDPRLLGLRANCPDDGTPMDPTGEIVNASDDGDAPFWMAGFRCPLHADEVVRLWQPEFDPIIEAVLADASGGP